MGFLTRDKRQELIRIIVTAALFVTLLILEHTMPWISIIFLVLYLTLYIFVGWDVVWNCILDIAHGQLFDESFLMTIATLGAFGCGEYAEAVAVMLFYQIGEFCQDYAVSKSRGSIQELLDLAPDTAYVEIDGEIREIDPKRIKAGDIVIVKPGEKVPVDGELLSRDTYLNLLALTGESAPRVIKTHETVVSGSISIDTTLRIKASKSYEDSTVAKIIELTEDAASRKSKTENFITRFARIYTPIVVGLAILIVLIPYIITGELLKWVLRACTFLVISCPCALVISIPLAFFGGIARASRAGILVKGSNFLEMFSQVKTIVSDKTGTLTQGKFEITNINLGAAASESELIALAAALEAASTHPIAKAIVEAASSKGLDFHHIKPVEQQNIPGQGLVATESGRTVCLGNMELMRAHSVNIPASMGKISSGTVVYIAREHELLGSITLDDQPKPEAREFVSKTRELGVNSFIILSGDIKSQVEALAAKLGIQDFRAELLPDGKIRELDSIIRRNSSQGYTAYIGDGINDAPVLARSDVGIAMGSLGSDAAIEAADIVIMDDQLSKVIDMFNISKRTIRIARANIIFALLVKLICLILGAFGLAGMWLAVFADVGVSLLCILNSMRLLITPTDKIS